MKYWVDLTYGGTIEEPLMLLRKKEPYGIVESYSIPLNGWRRNDNWNYKLNTGDDIFWEDITEEQAMAIIEKWKKQNK